MEHYLKITLGDCEFYGDCECGKAFGSIRPDQSFDVFAKRWEHHHMTEVK